MSTVQRADGRIENRVENYTKFWKKDPNREGSDDNEKRLQSYTDVVNGMYGLIVVSFFRIV